MVPITHIWWKIWEAIIFFVLKPNQADISDVDLAENDNIFWFVFGRGDFERSNSNIRVRTREGVVS